MRNSQVFHAQWIANVVAESFILPIAPYVLNGKLFFFAHAVLKALAEFRPSHYLQAVDRSVYPGHNHDKRYPVHYIGRDISAAESE